MAEFVSTMIIIGLYFIYLTHFHSIMPKHYTVLQKSAISHSVMFVAAALVFLFANY